MSGFFCACVIISGCCLTRPDPLSPFHLICVEGNLTLVHYCTTIDMCLGQTVVVQTCPWALLVLLGLSFSSSLLQAGCLCPEAIVNQCHVVTLWVDIGKNKPGFICQPFAKRMLYVASCIPPSFNYMLACMTSVASSSQKPSGGTELFCFQYF